MGKTALITQIVRSAVTAGLDPVHMFALEAAPGEIAARLAFEALARRSERKLDFSDFWRGRCKLEESTHWKAVEAELKPPLSRLHTLYKKAGDFDNTTLKKQLEAIRNSTQFVALDHIHVVDGTEGKDLSTQNTTVGLLRDFALNNNKPVVAASHTRKRQDSGTLLPHKDDLLGSKIISGVATVVIMVGRDWDADRPSRYLSPTLFLIEKDRRGRSSPYVARIYYDLSLGRYHNNYTLGRLVWRDRGQAWEPLDIRYLPDWAVRESRRQEKQPF